MPKFIDLTGRTFGKLKVMKLSDKRLSDGKGRTRVSWDCLCECGKETTVRSNTLTLNKTTSCVPCGYADRPTPNEVDLLGQRFGRLVIKERLEARRGKVYWKALCDCGNWTEAWTNLFTRGEKKSCGCLQPEVTAKRSTKHGCANRGEKTPTYLAYMAMKRRVLGENTKAYQHYYEMGVMICDRWLEDFQNFLDDMGEKPKGMTLDRKNNDLGYCKENCRWATYTQQAQNKSNNRLFRCGDEVKILTQWARELRVSNGFIDNRLKKNMPFPQIVQEAKEFVSKRSMARAFQHWGEDLRESA